ncbi:MAG: substrate-binding domain-containing protein, partial [Chloroflexi bacterium]|nr:substrate-binding domain-containing protein [Chloroflexota bacterium]
MSFPNTEKYVPAPPRPPAVTHRATIGFLLASLHTGASRALWPGLLDAARQQDVNLICFPGGRLKSPDAYENQRNAIYDLAGELCLDGLVTWSSSLGGVLGPAEIKQFHQRYLHLPMVSMAQFMEGMPTVSVDSYHGMRALLAHLIEHHGYRRIAFIRGPEGHYYAQERYRAYQDTLQAYQLPFLPELVTRPLRWESGATAVQILLDERGLRPGTDFQAVAAVSDLLALWALKTLQARGYTIPDDVAVTGFNNSIEERLAAPPLTTVDLPFYHQGARSVEVLLSLLAGENVPALITLPSNLVVRQSCGCPSAAVARAGYAPFPDGGEAEEAPSPTHWKEACLAEMAAVIDMQDDKARRQIEPILDALLRAIQRSQPDHFLAALNEGLDASMVEKRDANLWQDALSVLRKHALQAGAVERNAETESLLACARVVVSEGVQRAQSYWQWQEERQTEYLRETNRLLLTTFDIQKLTDVLAERLPGLGIPSAFLALYEEPGDPSEYARLVLAYTEQGRSALGPEGRRFQARQLVPLDLLPHHRRYSMVVEPLYFQEKSIGYILFEIGPQNGDVYELLRGNLSSAIQGAALFQEIRHARYVAEKADHIKTRLLANVSHELRTPLNIILGYTRGALQSLGSCDLEARPGLAEDLQHIQDHAEHQLRVINDLLDLSRAEIDELDLAIELIDPRPLLAEAFHSMAGQPAHVGLAWKLDLPERLPLIRADAVRLRQILLNLLSNARKFTASGQISLGAEVEPPDVHFWVSDTGLGIPVDQQERIFEPFVTVEHDHHISGGIGLGLSITRHLVALHGGQLTLESEPGRGSTFHIRLPLPALEQARPGRENAQPVLLLISSTEEPAVEIVSMCRRRGLEIKVLHVNDDVEQALEEVEPAAIAWDLSGAQPDDWSLVRRLRTSPRLSQLPFILYGQLPQHEDAVPMLSVGLTGFALKTPGDESLMDAINALCPVQASGAILIVDDDPEIRAQHQALVQNGFPASSVRTAEDGFQALACMEEETPALVLLDLMMPGMDGVAVLDQMRTDPRLRHVPVVILSNKLLSLDDVKRFEHHARVTFQTKGVWSDAETLSAFNRALFGADSLPP